ncbi:MAG: hypothetical protein AAGA58_12110 [Verrucomicrobiota bacterium]
MDSPLGGAEWFVIKALLRFPLWAFFVVGALCLLLKENYPFSHFPMYDQFPDHTFYVYLADGTGEPLAFKSFTGYGVSKFKKKYDPEIGEVRKALDKRKLELTAEERRESGDLILRRVYTNASEEGKAMFREHSPVRMYHVWIKTKEGKPVEEEAEMVGEVDFREG